MNITHYAKALLYIALAVVGVLVTALADELLTVDELVNIAIIGVGAVTVYLVPNLPSGPGSVLKTIVAFAVAGLVALQSFLTDGITTTEWLQVAVAAFAGIGVYIIPNEPAKARPLGDRGETRVNHVVGIAALLAVVLAAAMLIGAPSAHAATPPKAHTSAILVKAWPSFTDNPAGASPLPSLYLHRKTVKKVATTKCDSGRAYQATFYRWATIDRMHTPIFSQPLYLVRCL